MNKEDELEEEILEEEKQEEEQDEKKDVAVNKLFDILRKGGKKEGSSEKLESRFLRMTSLVIFMVMKKKMKKMN